MQINIKRLTGTAKIPTRGSASAAGYDLYADTDKIIYIQPNETVKIPTSIAVEIPEGYFGGIYSRSGMTTKRSLVVAQGTAVVDSDYRGNIFIPIHNDSEECKYIEPYERIAQLVIQPYLNVTFNETDILSETERGENGFGSSGTK